MPKIASYSHSRGTVASPSRVLIVPDKLSITGMVKLYRHMKANPDIAWTNKSNAWLEQYSSVEMWFEWFRDRLTKKIFSKGPQPGQGNKSMRRRHLSVRHECPIENVVLVSRYRGDYCKACKDKGKK